uniref:SUN domain-containing protein n=1 Tax=Macrostomum lignano TaxID=282301 RepID=A0A1I8IUF9_9PLAT
MSRRSDSRHSSPLSVRSSAASVTEPSDRLLRSECRRQGGKHCGHVECQVRSSLSRRSGGHQHDHAAPSQTATPSSLSPTLSTVSSSSQEEEDEELQEEDVDQQLVASESSSKIGSFRRMLSGGFSSLLWSSNSNNSNKRQTVEAEDERDIDEAQLSDADDLVMEKGSIEARLGTKDNLMPAFSDQLASAAAEDAAGGVAMETRARRQSLIRRATHPLLWLLGAIYYFAKLTLNRTANKLSNTAKHTVAIVTSGIALLLNSARAASCRLATGIGQVGGGIRRGFANAFAMTVGSVASMLRYANRATVVATASTKSIAGWVLQYSASAVRTLLSSRPPLVQLILPKLCQLLLSSKLASVTSQVDSIAQRLSRQSDETAATADAAAAASAAAVAAVNQSESARRLELASLRADLSRLANQHRRYFITVWNPDELADFALHTAGGYVVSIRCTKAYTVKRSYFHLFGVPVFSYSNGPNVALQPGLQLGECWPFLGFPGHVIVRLAAPARVSHVTIDHVPRSLTYNGSADSAPKNFSIYGLVNEQDSFQQAQLLGDFSYDADKGPSSQTFAIPADSPHRDRVYPAVELVIRSNHGAEHTCLYRFRVHGSLV